MVKALEYLRISVLQITDTCRKTDGFNEEENQIVWIFSIVRILEFNSVCLDKVQYNVNWDNEGEG